MAGLSSPFLHTITLNPEDKYTKLNGIVTTVAGRAGVAAHLDGPLQTDNSSIATIAGRIICGVFDSNDNFYAVTTSNCIKKITPSGVVSNFIGSPSATGAYSTGIGASATINSNGMTCNSISIDTNNNIYIVQTSLVAKITTLGVMTTFLGSVDAITTNVDASGVDFRCQKIYGIQCDNADNIYVVAGYTNLTNYTGNVYTKKFKTDGTFVSNVIECNRANIDTAIVRVPQSTSQQYNHVFSDQLITTGIQTVAPTSEHNNIVVDSNGNMFFIHNFSCVRKLTPSGEMTTFVGNDISSNTSTTPVAVANGVKMRFRKLRSITIDSNDNLYVSDHSTSGTNCNGRIYKITTNATVSVYAGATSSSTTLVTGALGTGAFVCGLGLWYRNSDNCLFFIDDVLKRVVKVDNSGTISLYYTFPNYFYGTNTNLYANSLIGDSTGNLYFSSYYYHAVYKIPAPTIGNTVPTANSHTVYVGIAGTSGDGTDGQTMTNPRGLAIDGSDILYIATKNGILKTAPSFSYVGLLSITGYGASPNVSYNTNNFPINEGNGVGVSYGNFVNGIFLKNNILYTSDADTTSFTSTTKFRLRKYNISTTNVSTVFGRFGCAPIINSNQFFQTIGSYQLLPNYMLFDDDNNIYLYNFSNNYTGNRDNSTVYVGFWIKINNNYCGNSTVALKHPKVPIPMPFNMTPEQTNSTYTNYHFDKKNKRFLATLSTDITSIYAYKNYYYDKNNNLTYYDSSYNFNGTLLLNYIKSSVSDSNGCFYKGVYPYIASGTTSSFPKDINNTFLDVLEKINDTFLVSDVVPCKILSTSLTDVGTDTTGSTLSSTNGNAFINLISIGFDSGDNLYTFDAYRNIKKINSSLIGESIYREPYTSSSFTSKTQLFPHPTKVNPKMTQLPNGDIVVAGMEKLFKIKTDGTRVDFPDNIKTNGLTYYITDMESDGYGNIYISVWNPSATLLSIYKIDTNNTISAIIPNTNTIGATTGVYGLIVGGINGTRVCPRMTADKQGNVYVIQPAYTSSSSNPALTRTRIWKIPYGSSWSVADSTVNGNYGFPAETNVNYNSGLIKINNMYLSYAAGFTIDPTGIFYISTIDNKIIKVKPDGFATLLAGDSNGASGTTNGTGTNARFNGPTTMAINSQNHLFVIDSGSHTIRKIT